MPKFFPVEDCIMEHEFISDVETWGSGGQMLDVVTLKNGEILLITGDALVL